ncbi:Kinase D-interacting substrate of 220 kDa [Symbiodinium microadriaticum]|uniref:Kinase D-interacting substrate of 220 kDa n=1 Tax=Symbiodinium microadriaticum TaxID=2951 RepID=A0A1Q9BWV3_SYMMI|nr:Kinase D-interacting substrate of 220 kDa [Symbiodinium microadriaticum]
MLQLRMLSGETVACIPVEEIHDVKALKQRLTQMHGMPPRFRQRVLLHGENLEDDVALDGPMSLDLALLGFADVSQQQVDELAAAALHGSISEVESMMQLPQDPDLIGAERQPALTIASGQGRVDVVRLLLEAGADKNLVGKDGCTAMMEASLEGHVDVVRVLLDAGAHKDLADDDGLTALMRASLRGHVQVVRVLVEAGANTDLATDDGLTALMLVSLQGRVDVVRLLVDAGADTTLADNNGTTALMMGSHVEGVRKLLVGAALSMVYVTGQPVVFVGTGQKYTHLRKMQAKEVVKTLLG